MSLRYGILGFLSKWEATGYDIKKEFDDFMSIFWHCHLSQIYPELAKMEQEQLITSQLIEQSGKPDKKMYSITKLGEQALLQWLLTPPEPPKIKDAFLMQTFFMDNIPPSEVIFQLKAYQKERQKRLDKMKTLLQERWEEIKTRDTIHSRIVMSSAALRRGFEQEVQYIKWCEDTIQFVQSCQFLWENEAAISGNPTAKQVDLVKTSIHRYFEGLLD